MTDTVKVVGSPTAYNANLRYAKGSSERQAAVAAVLEIFHAQASARMLAPGTPTDNAFAKLSEYADQIEEALSKSN